MTCIFIDFPQLMVRQGPALFLLGDIFQAWVGTGDDRLLVALAG